MIRIKEDAFGEDLRNLAAYINSQETPEIPGFKDPSVRVWAPPSTDKEEAYLILQHKETGISIMVPMAKVPFLKSPPLNFNLGDFYKKTLEKAKAFWPTSFTGALK